MKRIFSLFLFLLSFWIVPVAGRAAVDIGFSGGTQDIFFSVQKLVVGDRTRIYARVHNFGDTDVAAHVLFYQGDQLIGDSQVISVRAKGLSDEVYVDWTVPRGQFNIRSEVRAQEPRDENSGNDTALTSVLIGEDPPPPPPPPPSAPTGASGPPSSGGVGAPVGGLASSVGSSGGRNKKDASAAPAPKTFVALAPPLAPTVTSTTASLTASPEAPAAVEITGADLLKVHIDVEQQRWNRFRFSADANRSDGVSYEWSFGDGKVARGENVTHAFRFAGRYTISVVASQETGERAQDKVTLTLSFWNLGNWQLWLVLLFLLLLVLFLLLLTRGEPRLSHPHDRAAAEEGETPPILLAEESVTPPPPPVKKKRRPPPVRKKKEVFTPIEPTTENPKENPPTEE